MSRHENTDLSPTSHGEDDSDVILSNVAEIEVEPVPGLNGVPVRCMYRNTRGRKLRLRKKL
jgi:phosphatidylserine synthase 2